LISKGGYSSSVVITSTKIHKNTPKGLDFLDLLVFFGVWLAEDGGIGDIDK